MAQETSLRTPRRAPTRKPTIAPPVPIPGQGPTLRGGAKSRVDDRIKKRMSMRYAEMVASPTDMDAVPPMPGYSGGGGPSMMSLGMGMEIMGDEDVRDRGPSRSAQDDKKILDDDRFDPDACKSPSFIE